MALRNHPSAIPNEKPSLDYLRKHVIKDDEFGHWFWKERKGKRTHDFSTGQALVSWSVYPTSKTDYVSKGRYNVARLLIEHEQGPLEPRAKIHSLCGLPQCINPRHWGRHERAAAQRLAKLNGRWCLVTAANGREVTMPTLVHIRTLEGVVHYARVAPPSPIVATCGAVIDPETSFVVDAPVTCPRCTR